MHNDVKNFWEILLQAATMLGAIVAFAFTLFTWRNSNRVKRSEFLENLIQEFNAPGTLVARRILDDFWLLMEIPLGMSDEELVEKGSEEKIEEAVLSTSVQQLLRDHRKQPVNHKGEQRARQSFDDLLDFFAKIDYYLNLRLITKDEIRYFQYYLQRCAVKADGAVLDYARTYGYDSLFRLIYVMNIDPAQQSKFRERLVFLHQRQKKRYQTLRNQA